jgi:dTDP-4-amino-4,6-dideoxygalactose transaminase
MAQNGDPKPASPPVASRAVRVPLLDLQAQYARIESELDAALTEVVRSQRFVLGPVVESFEESIAARVGVEHAVGCASGTDALLLPLRALELDEQDEVIVPAFTFFATAGAVWNARLRPVFADIDPRTFNLTAATIEAALTPRTRAVIVVHLFGQMAPMAEIMELAERHGLHVIEDAAQSIDARQRHDDEWRMAGSLGTAGSFSFFPTKNLGGFGDGGMMTSRDAGLADRLRKLRVHGGRQMYHHEMVGFNSRLDAIQAAVLAVKLPHLEEWTAARRENAAYYTSALEGAAGIETPYVSAENYHVYNQYTIRSPDRDRLRDHLDRQGVGSGIYYPVPLHLQECFADLGYGPGDFPEAEAAVHEVLSLPVYPELTPAQRETVARAVAEFA